MAIQVKVSDHINQPLEKVFETIIDQQEISKYFVSSSSDKIATGAKIIWEFKDYDVTLEVHILDVIENKKIQFEWEASGNKAQVIINFSEENKGKTNIEITEDSFEENEEGIKRAMGQTQGWTDFICSLKAYLYTGINLRTAKMN